MRAALLALVCAALLPAAGCTAGVAQQTQWGRQARMQCDRQPDPRSRGECVRRVEEAERTGQVPAE